MALYVIFLETVGWVGFAAHEGSEMEMGGGMLVNLENSWNGLEQPQTAICLASSGTLIPLHLGLRRTYGLLFYSGL